MRTPAGQDWPYGYRLPAACSKEVKGPPTQNLCASVNFDWEHFISLGAQSLFRSSRLRLPLPISRPRPLQRPMAVNVGAWLGVRGRGLELREAAG